VLGAAVPREYKRNVQGWEKMYAEKRVVIVVAVVFVVCALLFCNAAPAIAATPASATLTATTNTTTRAVNRNATPAVKPASTTLTATTNTTTPATNQPFTLSGTLTANGTPLPGKLISLGRTDPSGTWSVVNTTTTTNGAYTFTRSESTQGRYSYQAVFAGDTTYTPANASVSLTVDTLTPTTVTNVQANVSHAGTNDQKNLSTVSVGNASPSGVQASDQLGVNAASSAPTKVVTAITSPTTKVVTATIPLTPTTITITTNNTTPTLNQPFTLNGTLTANGTPLPGKSITLGRTDPSGTYTTVNTTTTGANGAYTFTRSESTQGRYSYLAVFYGDTYAPANAQVTLTVGTLTPTTITITTNTTTPAVNQPFTLSGTLTANGTPLPGKLINLGRTDPSGNWSVAATTTTNANGTYTFTRSESTPGRYTYFAIFSGASTYAPSNASVSLTVGTPTPTT